MLHPLKNVHQTHDCLLLKLRSGFGNALLFRHTTMREPTFRLRSAHLFGSLRISLLVENYFVGFGSTECGLSGLKAPLRFPGNEEKTP
jgi:hypothetical protein